MLVGVHIYWEKKMKKFLITIDTEGDNLWSWKAGERITTKNVYFLQRFQYLCNKYHFKPIWLSNWEMVKNDDFVDFIKESLKNKTCELGMHLHAWNTPPIEMLPECNNSGAPYLIEYSSEIMEAKIRNITELIDQKFGFSPISHRAGRWAMNDIYFELLWKYGYRVDCSYTPGVNWNCCQGQTPGFGGVDYRQVNCEPHVVKEILEVPVSIKICHKMFIPDKILVNSVLKMFYHAIKGKNIWLRPNGNNLSEMLWLIDKCVKTDSNYLMFMIHSSELMPNGSPTFPTKESIEHLYEHLEIIFDKIAKSFEGITLEEYYKERNLP